MGKIKFDFLKTLQKTVVFWAGVFCVPNPRRIACAIPFGPHITGFEPYQRIALAFGGLCCVLCVICLVIIYQRYRFFVTIMDVLEKCNDYGRFSILVGHAGGIYHFPIFVQNLSRAGSANKITTAGGAIFDTFVRRCPNSVANPHRVCIVFK